jgi:hypothetical protein
MFEARVICVSIDRPWREVYEAVWRPEFFPRWASGLAQSGLRRNGDGWMAQGSEGPVRIRFTDCNPFGVMDHTVEIGNGEQVYVPMRVVANGGGAEVQFTLYRLRGVSEAKYAEDAEWVARDLAAPKALIDSSGVGAPVER